MNFFRSKEKFAIVTISAVLSGAFVFAAAAEAQTRPSATPQPDVPMVISRADDFPDEEQQVQLVPTPVEQPGNTNSGRSTAELRMLAEQAAADKADKNEAYEAKQRRLLMNLDILTRAEERAEKLRDQLFEMIEKENAINTRLAELQYSALPETIERNMAFTGSLKPEQLREMRRKSIEAEKTNQEKLLLQVQERKNLLTASVLKADELVEKIRTKLERDIDEALADDSSQ
jgi:hypothetical protein